MTELKRKKKPGPRLRESRGGARWTDRDYELRGYRRIGLRLPTATLDKLNRAAKKKKMSRAELLVKLIASY